jgi:hypothetical protein
MSTPKKSLVNDSKTAKKDKVSTAKAKEAGVKGARVTSLRLSGNHNQTVA